VIRSDNSKLYGKHCFEAAGLGIPPFSVSGFEKRVYQACPGAAVQPGASCAYCGTGIIYCCVIKDAHGKTFVVGSDCVQKTGDAGIIRQYKTHPDVRKHQRDLAQAKHMRNVDELQALLKNPPPGLAKATRKTWDGKDEPVVEFIGRVIGSCGMAGWARYLRWARQLSKGDSID
jgi:hypothetical protein